MKNGKKADDGRKNQIWDEGGHAEQEMKSGNVVLRFT